MEQELESKSNAWGVSSMVTGILSLLLFLMPYFGLPLAIFATIAYGMQKKVKQSGLATAGLVTGVIGIILNGMVGMFLLVIILASYQI